MKPRHLPLSLAPCRHDDAIVSTCGANDHASSTVPSVTSSISRGAGGTVPSVVTRFYQERFKAQFDKSWRWRRWTTFAIKALFHKSLTYHAWRRWEVRSQQLVNRWSSLARRTVVQDGFRSLCMISEPVHKEDGETRICVLVKARCLCSKTVTAFVLEDVTVLQVMEACREATGLPATGPITAFFRARCVQPSDTIADLGLCDGDLITLGNAGISLRSWDGFEMEVSMSESGSVGCISVRQSDGGIFLRKWNGSDKSGRWYFSSQLGRL